MSRRKRFATAKSSVSFRKVQLTRSGTLLRLRRGYEIIARQADGPVVPVWLDQLWGSIFSFQGRRFFTKWPRRIFRIPRRWNSASRLRLTRPISRRCGRNCSSWANGATAGARRLRGHLGAGRGPRAGAASVSRPRSSTEWIRVSLSRGNYSARRRRLSRILRKNFPDSRIGIVLPASKGGVVANLAVVLAGKVPVGLNFTSGRAALRARAGNCRIENRHFRDRFHQTPDGFSVA